MDDKVAVARISQHEIQPTAKARHSVKFYVMNKKNAWEHEDSIKQRVGGKVKASVLCKNHRCTFFSTRIKCHRRPCGHEHCVGS